MYSVEMSKTIKTIPKRQPLEFKYTDTKDRKMVSIRLPEALIAKAKLVAEETGCSFTELAQYALDQFCQVQSKSK